MQIYIANFNLKYYMKASLTTQKEDQNKIGTVLLQIPLKNLWQ